LGDLGRELEGVRLEQARAAEVYRLSFGHGTYPQPFERFKFGDRWKRDAGLFRAHAEALGDAVLGIAFYRRRQGKGGLGFPAVLYHRIHHAKLAEGQGSGLVKDDDIHVTRHLHGQSVANQNAISCPERGRDGDHQGDG